MSRQWPAAGLGALSVAVHAQDLLKGIATFLITSTIVWTQVNREGTQPCLSTENWIKDLLSMVQPFITRPSFPHSQLSQHQGQSLFETLLLASSLGHLGRLEQHSPNPKTTSQKITFLLDLVV